MKAAFLIAAPTSGSGKTTVARGLMALFVRHGLRVQPFKCGPDYIDTKFHAAVCGRPSVNLDPFMATPEHLRQLFASYSEDADVAVVEGMMGLFDGYDRDRGSCSEVARILGLPVVLVVDARSSAYSMAALLQGFLHFSADVRYAGVLYNKVGSSRHAAMLREVADEVGINCLGCLSRSSALEQGSRYLGLDFSVTAESDTLVSLLEEQVNWQVLLGIRMEVGMPVHRPKASAANRILVARNEESFSFIYQETLDRLEELGEVIFFDPEDTTLVPDFQYRLLYLPGGYPEKHLEALVRAERTRCFVRDFAAAGGRVLAECGGMMYLCQDILTDEGEFPMCGVLPYSVTARKADRRLSLGYRSFHFDGLDIRGHEFHYTRFVEPLPASSVQVYNAKGEPVPTPILHHGHVFASYTHLSPEAVSCLGTCL